MKNSILIAAVISAFTVPALADDLTLEDVRSMSDDELYALAETLSAEDEEALYEQARREFPEGALGLQSVMNKFQKSENDLKACVDAVDSGKASSVRALSELEPGTYFSLLRIISNPSDAVHDMTIDERKAESKRVTRDTNRVLREFRECKRKYRKRFGDG